MALPEKFKDLEQWTAWALPTERERHAKRAESSLEEIAAFCGALKKRMDDLIQYLTNFEWGTPLSAEDEKLYHLGLGYMEATIPIDLGWKQPLAVDSFPVERVALPERR